jgi:hypothetical protein
MFVDALVLCNQCRLTWPTCALSGVLHCVLHRVASSDINHTTTTTNYSSHPTTATSYCHFHGLRINVSIRCWHYCIARKK